MALLCGAEQDIEGLMLLTIVLAGAVANLACVSSGTALAGRESSVCPVNRYHQRTPICHLTKTSAAGRWYACSSECLGAKRSTALDIDAGASAITKPVGCIFPLRYIVGDQAGGLHRGVTELGIAGNFALYALTLSVQ